MVRLQLPPAPPAFARCAATGEGCRAEARSAQAGFLAGDGLQLGKPILASWCNSSMPGFDPDGLGANPSEASKQFSLGGEIESRLAYTQKSRGQNLPGRPAFGELRLGKPWRR